jgi:hypothetical protein
MQFSTTCAPPSSLFVEVLLVSFHTKNCTLRFMRSALGDACTPILSSASAAPLAADARPLTQTMLPYTHTRTHTRTHTCSHSLTLSFTHTHARARTRTHLCIICLCGGESYVCVYACVCVCVCVYACVCMLVSICVTYTCVYLHTYCVCICAHMYICVCVSTHTGEAPLGHTKPTCGTVLASPRLFRGSASPTTCFNAFAART